MDSLVIIATVYVNDYRLNSNVSEYRTSF